MTMSPVKMKLLVGAARSLRATSLGPPGKVFKPREGYPPHGRAAGQSNFDAGLIVKVLVIYGDGLRVRSPLEGEMPRFFFRTYDSEGEPHLDRDGVDLPDIQAARRQAARALREMACAAPTAEEQRYFAVDVLDQSGNTVVRARMSETIETTGPALLQAFPATPPAEMLFTAFFGQTAH
jgi:hypothetical protein